MNNAFDILARGAAAPADGNYPTQRPVIPNRGEPNEGSLPGSDSRRETLRSADSAQNDTPETAASPDLYAGYGPNNERLEDAKPHLVNALRELVRQYREEGVVARRHEIRRIRQARLFWQGLQYAWWNPNDMNWHLPFEQRFKDDRELEEMPRYQFVTNFYQGFGLSFVAVLSQDVPSVRFYPQSAQSIEDIGAARAASDVAELIEQNNHVEHLLTSIGYFLWTDGKLGAYVRYIVDGPRFGFHEENILEAIEIPLGEDVYVCPDCGKEVPAHPGSSVLLNEAQRSEESVFDVGEGKRDSSAASLPQDDNNTDYASVVGTQPATAGRHAAPQLGAVSCPNCGAPLTDANLR